MDPQLRTALEAILQEEVLEHRTLSGGDISHAYLIRTNHQRLFLKVNSGLNGIALFEAEQHGLQAISEKGVIATPRIVHCGSHGQYAVLILEYIETKQPNPRDVERLGRQVARLHQVTGQRFGLELDNFIGKLPQANDWSDDWVTFYISRRLRPQLILARNANLLSTSELPDESSMSKLINELCAEVRPSLLHGDLWSGNYLIAHDGTPFLIDPAVYYGHHEVDLAMSRLFGGFGNAFYQAYYEVIPEAPGAKERNEIYQLYYLLVHLNLFGAAYLPAVLGIMRRYFR